MGVINTTPKLLGSPFYICTNESIFDRLMGGGTHAELRFGSGGPPSAGAGSDSSAAVADSHCRLLMLSF